MKKSVITKDIHAYSRSAEITNVGVALSGGSDSVCLLMALLEADVKVKALHCNFNLRGDESLRDRDFVINLCRKFSIELTVKEFDTHNYIKQNKNMSIEMACRKLRYDWFLKLWESGEIERIVLGHNADDNIETFFINMLRGSGTAGLKGMVYDNGYLWRPLLKFHKESILKFLEDRNLPYVTDSTNLDSDYRRNFLRNKVIPLIKEEWKGFEKAMDTTIDYIYGENKIVETRVAEILNNNISSLPISIIKKFEAPELLIRRFIEPLNPFTTTASEIMNAIRAEKPHAPVWELPGGTVTIRKHKLILLNNKDK